MSHDSKQKRSGLIRRAGSTALVALFVLGLGGCLHDSSNSSSGGGSATLRDPNAQNQANTDTTGNDIACQDIRGRGILWKPVSEGDGNLVVLLFSSFGDPAVFVIDTKGNAIERGRHVGRTNGNRATYRFRRPGHHFGSPAVLQIGQGAGVARFFCVPNTGARWE